MSRPERGIPSMRAGASGIFFGFFFFVPADMLQRRYGNDEIVYFARAKIDNILIDDAVAFFVFVYDLMVGRKIVQQYVATSKMGFPWLRSIHFRKIWISTVHSIIQVAMCRELSSKVVYGRI